MSGVTKHIFEYDIRDIVLMWSEQLKTIQNVLPQYYTDEDIISALNIFILTNGSILRSVCCFTGCNHMTCTDGQHRICIAGKLGVEIEVRYMNDVEGKCTVCVPWHPIHNDCKEFIVNF